MSHPSDRYRGSFYAISMFILHNALYTSMDLQVIWQLRVMKVLFKTVFFLLEECDMNMKK